MRSSFITSRPGQYPLLSTGSTQEDRKLSRHELKIVERDIKHQHKQTMGGYNYSTCAVNQANTVKPVLSSHSKIDKTKVLMTNGSLMKVESIAECSPWSILQYF